MMKGSAWARGDGVEDDLALLHRLRSAPELFARLAMESGSELAIQQRLRQEFPDDLVRGALRLTELRRRGGAKFSRAAAMWFDRAGLEQATSEPVARHKALRFAGRPRPVWDLCCGLGADAVALAASGEVVAVDENPAACLRTQWNAEVYGVGERVGVQSARVESIVIDGSFVHIDPDRRASGRRAMKIEDYQPGLEWLRELAPRTAGAAIKLSPAANFGGKFPGSEIELISLDGECKEAVVWSGALRTATDWRATVLPAGATLTGDPWAARGELSPLQGWLYDPDPAVVRAGLVDVLCQDAGLMRLDPAEEYLTGPVLIDTPFSRAFEVLAELPNNDRALKDWFRRADCGELEIKHRRIPGSPDTLRRRLRPTGTGRLTLVLARIGGKARGVVCRRPAGAVT